MKILIEEDELYERYKDGLEKYAAIQLKQGNNNLHMRRFTQDYRRQIY
ncbi:MAG: hypothetical protein ACLT2Z_00935 [Eubacterium sp.]